MMSLDNYVRTRINNGKCGTKNGGPIPHLRRNYANGLNTD
jgi:hypothetical protein